MIPMGDSPRRARFSGGSSVLMRRHVPTMRRASPVGGVATGNTKCFDLNSLAASMLCSPLTCLFASRDRLPTRSRALERKLINMLLMSFDVRVLATSNTQRAKLPQNYEIQAGRMGGVGCQFLCKE